MKLLALLLILVVSVKAQALDANYKIDPTKKDVINISDPSFVNKQFKTKTDMTMSMELPSIELGAKTANKIVTDIKMGLDYKFLEKGNGKAGKLKLEFQSLIMKLNYAKKEKGLEPVDLDLSNAIKGKSIIAVTDESGNLISAEGFNELALAANSAGKDDQERKMASKMFSEKMIADTVSELAGTQERLLKIQGKKPGDQWTTSFIKNGIEITGTSKFLGWDTTRSKQPRAVIQFTSPRKQVAIPGQDSKTITEFIKQTQILIIDPQTKSSDLNLKVQLEQNLVQQKEKLNTEVNATYSSELVQ